MKMKFEFATAGRIVFGAGAVAEVAPAAEKMGIHAFLVTGRRFERAAWLTHALQQQGLKVTRFSVAGEPTTDLALAAVQKARTAGCDLVVAFGGGSVIDTAKAVAALLTNSGQLMDYLEVIGRGRPLVHRSAPCIAIATTAGTGAEVTRNCVLGSPAHRVKVSMRSPLMLPRLAVVDPELTYSMPPLITAATGLDALTQLMEAFVSPAANPMTDGICREGLQRAARSLQPACENGDNLLARKDMCIASLFGGLALANGKLGAVHGIAGPFGGMFQAAHGAVCARLLPLVMEANVNALKIRASDAPALARYDEIARLVTGQPTARADEGIQWVKRLCANLKTVPLGKYGLREADFPVLLEKSRRASSMRGNPIELTRDELLQILMQAK